MKMKKYALLICFMYFSYALFSQNLVGGWQLNTPLVVGYESKYTFNSDGSFEYVPAYYNTLQVFRLLKGNYSLKGDSIFFTVTEVEVKHFDWENIKLVKGKNMVPEDELIWVKDGFDNVDGMRRNFRSASNYWSLSYYPIERIKISPKTYGSSFEYFEDDESHLILEGHKFNYKYIVIDGDFYYYLYGPSDIDE